MGERCTGRESVNTKGLKAMKQIGGRDVSNVGDEVVRRGKYELGISRLSLGLQAALGAPN